MRLARTVGFLILLSGMVTGLSHAQIKGLGTIDPLPAFMHCPCWEHPHLHKIWHGVNLDLPILRKVTKSEGIDRLGVAARRVS